jgi:hypothetical protein
MTATSPSRDVVATLHFYWPPEDGASPFFRVQDPSGAGIKNYSHDPHPVLIHDMRNRECKFSLDLHSFVPVLHGDAPMWNTGSDEANWRRQTENLIMQHVPSSQKVVIFDSVVRRAHPEETLLRPVRKVHIDQTPAAAWARARQHLPTADYRAAEQGRLRLRLINVWRALEAPVTDHPLVLAESASVADTDLVEVDHIYPQCVGQTYAVKQNRSHRFWYWSNMDPGEALIFVCFDSRQQVDEEVGGDGRGWRNNRCAHGSFEFPVGPDASSSSSSTNSNSFRKSLEMRCLVLG